MPSMISMALRTTGRMLSAHVPNCGGTTHGYFE